MRRSMTAEWMIAAAALSLVGRDAHAELFSKAYAFKAGTTLEINAELPGSIRLDSVQFLLPQADPARVPKNSLTRPKKPADSGLVSLEDSF